MKRYSQMVNAARRSLNTVSRSNPFGRFVTIDADWQLHVACESWHNGIYSCEIWNSFTGEEHSMLFTCYQSDRELAEAMGMFAWKMIG